MLEYLRVGKQQAAAGPEPIDLSTSSLARSPNAPIALRSLNDQHENVKKRIYRTLIPHRQLSRFDVDPITWRGADRSTFAEFLVAAALGLLDTPRIEWDAVDLRYQDRAIEVKSAAYLQSWHQDRLSTIRFDIAQKRGWDAGTNTYAPEPTRSADCYVFCLYPETDPARADILDVAAWQFYVLSTQEIDRAFAEQKTVALSRVRALCQPAGYQGLKDRVDAALEIVPF